jgi:AcrR family transcriptional regulator
MRRTEAVIADRAQLDAETRMRIEQAVLDIFAEREFHRVGLIEIARGANVSLQTIYKYYGSKEALLFSSLDAWLGKLAVRMVDHLQGIEDYKEKLRKVFWVVLDFFEKNPKVAQIVMSSVYVNTWRKQEHYQNPVLFGAFLKVLGEGRARGVLNDQVEEKYLLDFIMGVLGRLVQMYIHRGMKESLTAQATPLFEMLWRGISKAEMGEPAAAPGKPAPRAGRSRSG